MFSEVWLRRNPNVGHRFPIPIPYYQLPMQPVFHAIVPLPHIGGPGYAYQPVPGPFFGIEPQLVKSGPETTMHAFGPLVQGTDSSRNMQPPSRGDPNAYPANLSNRRPNKQEPGGHLNPGWNCQRAYNIREPIPMKHRPRPFVRPPFFGLAPGFMVGPSFPGAVCYMLYAFCFSRLYKGTTSSTPCSIPYKSRDCCVPSRDSNFEGQYSETN